MMVYKKIDDRYLEETQENKIIWDKEMLLAEKKQLEAQLKSINDILNEFKK